MNWVETSKALPLASICLEGSSTPIISEDVMVFFGEANGGDNAWCKAQYDYEESRWYIVEERDGFYSDVEPTHWAQVILPNR